MTTETTMKASPFEAKFLGQLLHNNNNGFSYGNMRFSIRRRHRVPPFALGYHRFIKLVAIQDEGEGEGGRTSRVGHFHVSVWVLKKSMVGKVCF